jgi:hypothetical protein
MFSSLPAHGFRLDLSAARLPTRATLVCVTRYVCVYSIHFALPGQGFLFEKAHGGNISHHGLSYF